MCKVTSLLIDWQRHIDQQQDNRARWRDEKLVRGGVFDLTGKVPYLQFDSVGGGGRRSELSERLQKLLACRVDADGRFESWHVTGQRSGATFDRMQQSGLAGAAVTKNWGIRNSEWRETTNCKQEEDSPTTFARRIDSVAEARNSSTRRAVSRLAVERLSSIQFRFGFFFIAFGI